MATLLRTLFGRPRSDEIGRYSLQQYIRDLQNAQLGFGGLGAATTQNNGRPAEDIENSFTGYVNGAYKRNGVIFAIVLSRLLLFTEARFCFRDSSGKLTTDPAELALLRKPWPNGTTGELLARMEQDVSLAGNFYAVNEGDRLRRLRPDWVSIILSAPPEQALASDVIGYQYSPGGHGGGEAEYFLPDEVCHWSPIPDPDAQYRGMSWLTPVIEEITADGQATTHKRKFFEQGATPQVIVKVPAETTVAQFKEYVAASRSATEGVENAYKTWYVGGGADPTVVGANLQQMDFKATQGAGEPLALDTPIPTPTGWTTMGEIAIGDQVIGRDGLPARVLGVSPVHVNRDCYRVTFNDRTSIVADGGHLWAAMDRNTNDRAEKTYTTVELRELIADWERKGESANRIGIAPAAPVKLPARDLLVDPYVLGAWLGDGQTAGAAICGAEDDLSFIADEIEQRGYTTTRWADRPGKVPVIGLPGGLLAALKAIGVLGNKHIPTDYLRASVEQRLDLLRGLMDTDGTVGHAGHETCEFSSKFEHLANQVADLVRSLGYRATVSCKRAARSRTGMTWRVMFRANPEMVPFLLPRKAARCVTPLHVRNRAIVSIEPIESVPVRCIMVDSPDHLFVAGDGWVLTHNTRICAAGGVPPIIVGLSEGLSSATYSNYGMARRKFGDHWARPSWRSACAALSVLVDVPDGEELWYLDRDIAFLREDQKDAAEIQQIKASTIASYIVAGMTPASSVASVEADDLSLLEHSGLVSVQLLPPGQDAGHGTSPADAGPDKPVDAPVDATQRATLLAEIESLLERRFDPSQLRDHDGKWTDGLISAAGDPLKLAERIRLGRGESLAASSWSTSKDSPSGTAMALVTGPDGPRLRLGIIVDGDQRSWSGANKGGTVVADPHTMTAIHEQVGALAALGDERAAPLWATYDANQARMREANARRQEIANVLDYTGDGWQARVKAHPELDAEYKRLTHEVLDLDEYDYSNEPDTDQTFAEGVIPGTEWGTLQYSLEGTDDDRNRWKLLIAVRPDGAGNDFEAFGSDNELVLDAAGVKKFLRQLDAMRAAAAERGVARSRRGNDDELHHYWTTGEGLAKWSTHAHPWTALRDQLAKHVGPMRAARMASQWFHEVMGVWPGERKGSNPAGPG